MIKGLRTVIYPTPDLAAAKAWYSEVLDKPPYFDEPFYSGFEVGDFELGLIPDGLPGSAGAAAYWGVLEADSALARLQQLGGTVHEALKDVGDGIKVASVLDPFGNVFGIIENPNFNPKNVE